MNQRRRVRSLFSALALVVGTVTVIAECGSPALGDLCAPPQTGCGDGASAYCASLQSDNLNCGACGTTCSATTSCVRGVCAPFVADAGVVTADAGADVVDVVTADVGADVPPACAAPTPTLCGATCTNTMTDSNNCGACGTVCASGVTCSMGSCPGEMSFTTPGSFMWTVPSGVTSVSVVVVGAGGGGNGGMGSGGGGGGLCYANITVTPGASVPVVVGAGVVRMAGGDSSFNGVLIARGGSTGTGVAAGVGGGGSGGTCFTGGSSGTGEPSRGGGGGGAAGYAGNGGNGGDGVEIGCARDGSPGAGGGGGGGAGDNGSGCGSHTGGAGGGVGLNGTGTNGAAGIRAGGSDAGAIRAGGGGSGGSPGNSSTDQGGNYGGGARLGAGAGGAVRIIWGAARSFPDRAM